MEDNKETTEQVNEEYEASKAKARFLLKYTINKAKNSSFVNISLIICSISALFYFSLKLLIEAYTTSLNVAPKENIKVMFSLNDAFIGIIATLIGIMVTFVIGYQILNALQIKKDIEENKSYTNDLYKLQTKSINSISERLTTEKSLIESQIENQVESIKLVIAHQSYFVQSCRYLDEVACNVRFNCDFSIAFTYLYRFEYFISSTSNYTDDVLKQLRETECIGKLSITHDACYSIVLKHDERNESDNSCLNSILNKFEKHKANESNERIKDLCTILVKGIKTNDTNIIDELFDI